MIKSLKWESAGAHDHKGLGEDTYLSESVWLHFGFFVKQGEKSLFLLETLYDFWSKRHLVTV